MNRTTLTKSLHTVSVVARVALSIAERNPLTAMSAAELARLALDLLGMPSYWSNEQGLASYDPTFAACVAKVAKLRGGK